MTTPRVLVVITSALVVCGLAGCGGSSSSTASTSTSSASTSSAPATTAAATTVVLKNIAFAPDTLTVKTGDMVTWEWKDGAIPHNVDGKGSAPDLYSGSPQTSGTYQYTFAKSGTYHIVCDVHPTMKLTVTVS